MLADALRRLRRDTTWSLASTVDVAHDVGHPQGMTRWGGGWLVTTVHTDRRVGEVFVLTGDGDPVARCELVDGDRFHPGGVCAVGRPDGDGTDAGVWIALAEYRPRSSTVLLRLDPALDVVSRVPVDDHLGAVCELPDGSLVAVSWASSRWYRIDPDGSIAHHRRGSNRWIDVQDLQVLADGTVVGTGFGRIGTPAGEVAVGGLAVVDAESLVPIHEAPIAAWMPSGRPATYNATHLDLLDDGRVELHCLVDDRAAAIGRWRTTSPVAEVPAP